MLSGFISKQEVKTLISVCSVKDLEVWRLASKFISRNIKSKNYIVIVPDNEVELFVKNTNNKFKVKPESLFVGKLKETLKKKYHMQIWIDLVGICSSSLNFQQ